MITGNEPAFAMPPTFNDLGQTCDSGNDGLTIRQHFAAMAMQGILANSEFLAQYQNIDIHAAAVRNADALIIELNKPV